MFAILLDKIICIALHLEESIVFPEPLSSGEEKIYLERMKNGDKKAKDILIERNLRLVAHIIKKYYSANAETEELISVGTVGLIKGINSFDPDKGVRLATYVSRCIDNEILMFFRNKKKTALDMSFEDPIEQDSEGNPLTLMDIIAQEDTILEEICLKKNIKKLYKFIDEIDDIREKNILIMRYGLDGREPLTQSEIAEIFGISRSYVSRIETKCLKKLRKKFDN
ncbi:MAG: RNA polymerase sporulation sigma factor SigK [Oscillospiraceae bacterium]|nr:RNA polymerase sporulation sigma factor SigK [Oscillospiraceae bacterium]